MMDDKNQPLPQQGSVPQRSYVPWWDTVAKKVSYLKVGQNLICSKALKGWV